MSRKLRPKTSKTKTSNTKTSKAKTSKTKTSKTVKEKYLLGKNIFNYKSSLKNQCTLLFKLRPLDKTIDILNALLNEYLFIMIVSNHATIPR